MLTLYQLCHLQISSPILLIAFEFCCFLHCEVFYFDEVPIVIFAFVSLASGDISRKKLLFPTSRGGGRGKGRSKNRLLTIENKLKVTRGVAGGRMGKIGNGN